MERVFDRELARAACAGTATAQGSATLALEFDRYGNPLGAKVLASTLSECSAIECLRSALQRVVAPPARFGVGARYVETIVLVRGSVPRRAAPEERLAASAANDGCAVGLSASDRAPTAIQPLPATAISEVVIAASPQLRACYDRGHIVDDRLTGTVTTTIVIAPGGNVSSALITANTLPNCDVARCVRDTFAKLQFSSPQNHPARVEYPIHFSPSGDPFEALDADKERNRLAPGLHDPSW